MKAKILENLMYEGQLLGYRVAFVYKDIISKIRDIDEETLTFLEDNFNVDIFDHDVVSRQLVVTRDGRYVTADGSDYPEFSLDEYGKWMGYPAPSGSTMELQKMYIEYNAKYFNNELPTDVLCCWAVKMTAGAGVCKRRTSPVTRRGVFTIKFSPHYHAKFDASELLDTFVHEMIHVKHSGEGHNHIFHMEMNKLNKEHGLNITVRSKERATPKKPPKYIYQCTGCGVEFPRQKSLNLDNVHCGKCKQRIVQIY